MLEQQCRRLLVATLTFLIVLRVKPTIKESDKALHEMEVVKHSEAIELTSKRLPMNSISLCPCLGGLTWKAKQTLVPLEGEWSRLL